MPQRGARPALDQPPGRPPLTKGHRVVERCAAGDHGSGCLDVGAGVDQRTERIDVVAARGPVQRRLGVWPAKRVLTSAPAWASVVTVAGPLGKRPGQSVALWSSVHDWGVTVAPVVLDPRGDQIGMLAQQPLQPLDIAPADHVDRRDGNRIVMADGQHAWIRSSRRADRHRSARRGPQTPVRPRTPRTQTSGGSGGHRSRWCRPPARARAG